MRSVNTRVTKDEFFSWGVRITIESQCNRDDAAKLLEVLKSRNFILENDLKQVTFDTYKERMDQIEKTNSSLEVENKSLREQLERARAELEVLRTMPPPLPIPKL